MKKSRIGIRGIFTMVVRKNGVIVEEIREENKIVDSALTNLAHLIAGDVTSRSITHIAFGTSGTAPAAGDTFLEDQYSRLIDGFEYIDNNKVVFDWHLPYNEYNGKAILEFGLLTENGQLFARKVREDPVFKAADIDVGGGWIIEFYPEEEEEE